MAPLRQDWARLDWEFLRFDLRYRNLPDDATRMAYLHLWTTAVHLRQDTFERDDVTAPYLADLCGVSPELLASMVESSLRVGLLAKGPRGAVTVVGVRARHPKLRGWDKPKSRFHCGPIEAPIKRRIKREIERGVSAESEPETDSDSVPPVPYQQIAQAWNDVAAPAGCIGVRGLTDARKRKLATRWRDADWREHWLEAINLLPERPFACGENDRGWRMGLDFFLKPDTVTNIIEGKYAGERSDPSKRPVTDTAPCANCDLACTGAQLNWCQQCGKSYCYKCLTNHDCKGAE